MANRRNFIEKMGITATGAMLAPRSWAIPPNPGGDQPVRFGIISDLHHMQWGWSEEPRLKAFMDAVMKASPDFIVQCGDFCRPAKSTGIMEEWNRFPGPKYHVLGNHDMDVCDKATIMKLWGMERPYYSFDRGGFHFVVMDRNYLRKEDGSLADYASSNWGPLPSPQRSFTDKAQLDWLRKDLMGAGGPVIIFMHQPVFISDFFDEIGNAEKILAVFDEVNYAARKSGSKARVTAVFMGHDHDDRYGERNGVHYFLLNSSTYVYCKTGAYFYADSLFAFVTLDSAGRIIIEGRTSVFKGDTPDAVRAVFSTKISNHDLRYDRV